MANIFFGTPQGVNEGDKFPDRDSLKDNNLHRSLQYGIDGNGREGAAAIVLSGGYEDDVDLGDEIIYTGHGGRDSSTGKQIANQSWNDHGNLGLVLSEDQQFPVRVIRGYNHNSIFSPKTGYTYAGLFYIVEHWEEIGKSGFKICRFRLVKKTDSSAKNEFVVKEGSLVKVELNGKSKKWFSIGTNAPDSMKNIQKISKEGKLGKALLGKKVGDSVNFGNGITILEIKPFLS